MVWLIFVTYLSLFSILLTTVLMLISTTISKTSSVDREKSTFECGFDPKSYARVPLSL